MGVQSGGAHKFSKTPKENIRLIENFGIEGDAHAGSTDQHLFHIRKFGKHPNLRQVHLIASEFLDELDRLGHPVFPGDLGENITTRNADLLGLPTGTRLLFGAEAAIELSGLCNPCIQIDKFQSGLLQHCVKQAADGVQRKAGVMSVVSKGGIVRPADPITIELPPLPHQPLVYRVPDAVA